MEQKRTKHKIEAVLTKGQSEGVSNNARRCRPPQVRNSMIERYHDRVLVSAANAFAHVP
jgi:hypothetical protein